MNWYKSKTMWFNIVLGVIGILEASTSALKDLLGDNFGIFMMTVAMVGMFLRTITTKPMNEK